MVVSLDGQAMADGATSLGFSVIQGFKRVNTTIRRETNHAMQATLNDALDGRRYVHFQLVILGP
jgi:hypothetical protein